MERVALPQGRRGSRPVASAARRRRLTGARQSSSSRRSSEAAIRTGRASPRGSREGLYTIGSRAMKATTPWRRRCGRRSGLPHYRSGAFFIVAGCRSRELPLSRCMLGLTAAKTIESKRRPHKVFGSLQIRFLFFFFAQDVPFCLHLPRAVGRRASCETAPRALAGPKRSRAAIVACSFGDAWVNTTPAAGDINNR